MKYLSLIICLFSCQAFPQTNCEKVELEFNKIKSISEKGKATYNPRMFVYYAKIRIACKLANKTNCEKEKLKFNKLKPIYEKDKVTYSKQRQAYIKFLELYQTAYYAWMRAARKWVNKANKDDPIDKEAWNKANRNFDKAIANFRNAEVIFEKFKAKFKASPTHKSFKKAQQIKRVIQYVCEKRLPLVSFGIRPYTEQ